MIISAAIVDETPTVQFRRMTTGDIDAGLRLCRISGWDQVARDWERFLTPPSDAVVAVRDGLVLGTCATIRYGAVFAWIGMVLVDPDAQGQGLGAALLARAIDMLHDVPAIRLDATPAGHPLYVKQNFIEEARLRRMERVTPAPAPAETSEDTRVRQMTAADLPRVAAMDEDVFGAPRAELLEWMFRGAPEYAAVAIEDGRLAGYLLARHGFEFDHLGPIVARDVRIATALTMTCLARSARPIVIDAACHDERWLAVLEANGFREQRPFIRMYRGASAPFGESRHQFAVTGPEFG
jgi:GNAT superfamily N-acetyltransferase